MNTFPKTLFYASLALFLPAYCLSQEPADDYENSNLIEQTLESLYENSDVEEIDIATLIEELKYYYRHPMNLNNASIDDLSKLMILKENQISNVMLHREKYGKLISIYELQAIEGFDDDFIDLILPFVKVSDGLDDLRLSPREIFKNGKHEILIRAEQVVEQQNGFLPPDTLSSGKQATRYKGSPEKLYFKYRFTYQNKVSIGFTGEKDPGEEFFSGSNKVKDWYRPYQGFDFYSAHIYLRDAGIIKYLAIGDYQVQIGQGLTMWSGLAFGKSAANVINIKKSANTITPYTSVIENSFLRGAAATIKIRKRWQVTGFFSSNRYDASIVSLDTLTDAGDGSISIQISEISSLQQLDLHRTENELAGKDAIWIKLLGGHIEYGIRKFKIGATGVNMEMDASIRSSETPYNKFKFSGNKNFAAGADYSWNVRNFNFFGEVSVSGNGGTAFLNGVMASVDQRLSLAAYYRNFQKNYQPIINNPLSETGGTNEEGFYIGAEATPWRKWIISAYYDIFSFPWLRYLVDAPSRGNEFTAKVLHKPSKKLQMYVQMGTETKMKNATGTTDVIDFLNEKTLLKLRYHIDYAPDKPLNLRSRIDYSRYEQGTAEPENGFLIQQDIIFKPKKIPFTFTFRYALFDTKSYDSRIYSFEQDVIPFSIPAFSYRGNRVYLMVRYHIRKGIDVWARAAQTYYSNINRISSGTSEILGNTKTDIKLQLRIIF